MKKPVVIHWFRQDLRLCDNPSITAATSRGTVLPIYILDNQNAMDFDMGAASKWWLHHSLAALNASLEDALSLYQGNPIEILMALVERLGVSAVYWNRCYEPWQIQRDEKIKLALKEKGVEVRSYNASLLWEPWEIKKPDGTPYKVFTPFYRKGCLQAPMPREPIPKPDETDYVGDVESRLELDTLGLLPNIRWDNGFKDQWDVGESGAHNRFQAFINSGLAQYKEGRNLPAKPYVSRLSPYLHFGEISPNQLWYAIQSIADNADVDHFCSELAWREFSYSQLFNHPTLPTQNLKEKFDLFPWVDDKVALKAWQTGSTGIPMVDAGMRELWQTGYMHNRVRMIVASFLVKNLRLHWHQGERWFWDTLVDADLASNSASWQWVAGSGADAAPYFRIFNPVIQGQKFDSEGDYVRHFVPELASMPNKYLFNPWEASASILQEAKVTLGEHYPKPIVDLKASREAALLAYKML